MHEQRNTLVSIFKKLDASETSEETTSFSQYAGIIKKADSFDPLPQSDDIIRYPYGINKIVWNVAVELRKTGDLVSLGSRITGPVVAIRGDNDPHPAAGVKTPLSRVIKNSGHPP